VQAVLLLTAHVTYRTYNGQVQFSQAACRSVLPRCRRAAVPRKMSSGQEHVLRHAPSLRRAQTANAAEPCPATRPAAASLQRPRRQRACAAVMPYASPLLRRCFAATRVIFTPTNPRNRIAAPRVAVAQRVRYTCRPAGVRRVRFMLPPCATRIRENHRRKQETSVTTRPDSEPQQKKKS